VREQLERKANTTNGTYKVSGADIRAITMVQPPINEQQKIVQKIEELTGRFCVLMDSAEKLLIYLRERRTALISAAVTGKIDVRNWQPAG
jgi:type I restriction enzyme S subunit